MSADLFGETPAMNTAITPGAPRKRRDAIPRGYAGIPGTGPEGKQCRHCEHYVIRSLAKDYRKCALNRANWTGGRASDIKAKAPACSRFEEPR